jgi:immunity protein 49 of polymorphic toxin system
VKLADYVEPLSYDTAFWAAGVLNPEYPIEELGDLSLEVSEKLRAMAILVLLTKASTDTFYHNLIRSGRCREIYLRRCLEEKALEDHHRASGRYEPLCDSIAAGDFDLAGRIVRLSPDHFMAGHEYEDDYSYAQILHMLVNGDTTNARRFLQRFEVYAEGESNARLSLSNALVGRNQDAFDEAFEELLTERATKIQADKDRHQLEEPQVVAQRHIFVEGLAILRLAERQGLKTAAEYRYCPSLARVPLSKPFPGE